MNDELERLILNNRHSILDEEPLDGHFERFEARLQKAAKPSHKIKIQALMKIAASIIFVLLVVNQARIYFAPKEKETLSLGSISKEYSEVEFYYTSSIKLGMNQWEKLKKEGLISVPEQEMMQKEQEEFDQMYQKLQEDLKANPNDERVINAILEYYQTRMNITTMIINKLQDIKKQKKQAAEKHIIHLFQI